MSQELRLDQPQGVHTDPGILRRALRHDFQNKWDWSCSLFHQHREDMIRRRRPTPATLFRVADQSSPEDDQSTHQWVVGENGVLKPKRVNPNVYQPPSLKAVQKMAEAHMQKLGVYVPLEDPCEGEEEEEGHWEGEEGEDTSLTKDHQETATTEQSDKFPCMRESVKQIQAAQEEEEEEEEDEEQDKAEGTTEENNWGSN
uniref:protein phosphatase 1 regulatory subunit 1B isoform X2 n=1 Tax=Monopterus albus TaxID=43700 RepID=UPI0009B43C49|nr:protein phosphatase 1 regulatory subunit 1B isoform X2 [Monopterus albus]